jgi:hypothetical protein
MIWQDWRAEIAAQWRMWGGNTDDDYASQMIRPFQFMGSVLEERKRPVLAGCCRCRRTRLGRSQPDFNRPDATIVALNLSQKRRLPIFR